MKLKLPTVQMLLLLSVTACLAQPCFADDFPGKGDRFAWSSALPFYNRGNKYLEHGRIEEAVQDFEEAIYRYEYDPDFYINYGVALRKRENFTGAEQAFKKAIELRANDWQAWTNLANAKLKQNQLKETIACFQKALKLPTPPPPQEKAAILKDIADINKILSMQKPPAGSVKLGAGGTPVSTAGTPSQQAMGSGRSVLPGSKPKDSATGRSGSATGLSGSVVTGGLGSTTVGPAYGRGDALRRPAAKQSDKKVALVGKKAESKENQTDEVTNTEPNPNNKSDLKKSGWDWVN